MDENDNDEENSFSKDYLISNANLLFQKEHEICILHGSLRKLQ